MEKESCKKWRDKMKNNARIAFDVSWSHRRNADHCLVDLVDIASGKIVDFEIVSKLGRGSDPFEGPSNVMEVECLKRLIPRWKDDVRVEEYVQDKDSKSKKVLEEKQWNFKK